MGVYLGYGSVHPMPSAVCAAIKAQADQDHRERPWRTCEPIHFPDRMANEGSLIGRSKYGIVPSGVGAKWGHFADDLRHIIQTLAAWSKQYGVDWMLSVEDEELGRITAGEVDHAIGDFILEVEEAMIWTASQPWAR